MAEIEATCALWQPSALRALSGGAWRIFMKPWSRMFNGTDGEVFAAAKRYIRKFIWERIMPSLLNLLADYDGVSRPSAELNFTLKDVFPALTKSTKK